MFNEMCIDLDQAKLNRKHVEEDIGGAFYLQQARAIAQWGFNEPKPESVVVGELPFVGKNIFYMSEQGSLVMKRVCGLYYLEEG